MADGEQRIGLPAIRRCRMLNIDASIGAFSATELDNRQKRPELSYLPYTRISSSVTSTDSTKKP
jgi:hypothetical protein